MWEMHHLGYLAMIQLRCVHNSSAKIVIIFYMTNFFVFKVNL
jgi:hypothetical protein